MKILTRDKILSKDSVRDLFALFFNMSNLNLGALLDTSFTAFSAGGCEACKCLKTEMQNTQQHGENPSEHSEDFCNLNQYFFLASSTCHAFFSSDTCTEV